MEIERWVLDTIPCSYNFLIFGSPKKPEDLFNPMKLRWCTRAEECSNVDYKVRCIMLDGLVIARIANEENITLDEAFNKFIFFAFNDDPPKSFLVSDRGMFIRETNDQKGGFARMKWFAELVLSGKTAEKFPFVS